jgi:hypothetical protein
VFAVWLCAEECGGEGGGEMGMGNRRHEMTGDQEERRSGGGEDWAWPSEEAGSSA